MNTSKPGSSEAQAQVPPSARASQALRESARVPRTAASDESMFRVVFDQHPQPSLVARVLDGVVLEANQAFFELTGLTREQLFGRSLSQLAESSFEAGVHVITWHTPQGRDLRLAMSSTCIDVDGQTYLLHALTDVTQREPAEATWLDLIPVSVSITRDDSARQIEQNSAALALSRMQQPDAAPRFEVYVDGMRQAWEDRPLQRVARTGVAVHHFDEELRFDDGERVFLHGSAVPLRDAAGNPCGAIAAAVDVTPIRLAEAALRDKDRRKDDFLAMLSHELRNPLAPIFTALQLMQQRGDEQHAHEREVIERQARHLTRMVDDLLDVSRITRGKLELSQEVTELAPIVAKALEATAPLFERRRQELSVSMPECGLQVWADELRITQVFSNLLTNAARYTPLRGQIQVTLTREGEQAVARVRDNGVGIEASHLASIFDLFVQGERGPDGAGSGLGLGLALVRALTHLHGGTVEAHSAGAGHGSEFVVRLPLAAQAARSQPKARAAGRARYTSQHAQRVLVVDDNADAAEMLCALLTAAGHDSQIASDPVEALALAELFHPEVALLDIGLPVMDGYELGRRLSALFAPAQRPVLIALTGYGQDHDRRRSQAAGFAHHLVKPVNTDALLQLLDALPTP